MITRDPLGAGALSQGKILGDLRIPRCLLSGQDPGHGAGKKKMLPRISHLSKEEQMRVENDNVVQCLKWAGANL